MSGDISSLKSKELTSFAAFYRALCLPEDQMHHEEMDDFPESCVKVCSTWTTLLFWKKSCRNLPWMGRLWRPRSVPLLRFLCLSWAPSGTRANPCQTLLWKKRNTCRRCYDTCKGWWDRRGSTLQMWIESIKSRHFHVTSVKIFGWGSEWTESNYITSGLLFSDLVTSMCFCPKTSTYVYSPSRAFFNASSRPCTVFISFKTVSHMESTLSIVSCYSSERDDWSEDT